MPMHPRPMAETSRLLFPSLRFSIFELLSVLMVIKYPFRCCHVPYSKSQRRNLGVAMPRAPFPGRSAFPSLKGAKERVGIPITQKEGNPVQFDGTLFEIVVRQLTPGVFYKLLKGDVPIVKSAL